MASLVFRATLLLMLVGSITAPSSSKNAKGDQPRELVIKLSDYKDAHKREQMEKLRDVTEGRDPCKAYRTNRPVDYEKEEDEARECMLAIWAFGSLPADAQGPCQGFRRMFEGYVNSNECVPGEGKQEGYCAIKLENQASSSKIGTLSRALKISKNSSSSIDRNRFPLKKCTELLRFQP